MTAPVIDLGLAAAAGYEADEMGLFSTSSPAGWAAILALVGFVIAALIVGRGQGLIRGAGAALGLGLLILSTNLWTNFAVRQYALTHPDSPIAGGLAIDV